MNLNITRNIAEGVFKCPVTMGKPEYMSANEWLCTAGLTYCRLQLFEVVGGVFVDITDTLPKERRATCAFHDWQEDLPVFRGHGFSCPGTFVLVVEEKEIDDDPERVAYLWRQ